ncbi:MAG: RraA family protein [Candidatus Dormibacteria bacterium]
MTDVAAVSARLEALYVPAILDVMEERGLRNQALPPGLIAVEPGQKLAGPAFPYRFVAAPIWDRDLIIGEILAAYESAPEGSVLVAAAGVEPPYAAHFGELSAASCRARGLRGAIIDGGLRDGAYVVATGFPLWYRYRTPIDVVGRYRISEVGEIVELGGVPIAPGDYVVADIDGVVVVPAGMVGEITAAAEQCCEEEEAIRRRVTAKESAAVVFKDVGRF